MKEKKKRKLQEKQEEHHEQLKYMAAQERARSRESRFHFFSQLVRLVGSLSVCFDLVLKVLYFYRSKFANIYLRTMYGAFLYLKPCCLIVLIVYNYFYDLQFL